MQGPSFITLTNHLCQIGKHLHYEVHKIQHNIIHLLIPTEANAVYQSRLTLLYLGCTQIRNLLKENDICNLPIYIGLTLK